MIRWLAALFLVLASSRGARAAEPDAWYMVESPVGEALEGIRFARDGTGWAVGNVGTVLRYDGKAWRQIPGPEDLAGLRTPVPLGSEELWACGINRVYHYQQGRWSSERLDAAFECTSLDFLHPQLGYATGLFGMLYRYDGQRWERVDTPVLVNDRESHLDGVVVLAPDDVWVGGATGFVLHFDGKAWQRLQPRPTGGGGRLGRFGDTVALLDAPVLVRRAAGWQQLSPVAVRSLAARDGSVWGLTWSSPNSVVRLFPDKTEPARLERGASDLAEGPDGLWAVGDGGLIVRLGRRQWPAFLDRTFEAGVGVLSESTIATLSDLDDRGEPDLVLAVPFGPNSFLHANANGIFRVEPLAAPALSALPAAAALAMADLDGDGRIDLVLRPPGKPGARPLHVLRNLGDFRFWDVGPFTAPLEARDAAGLGDVQVADLDGDGDLDVYEVRFLHDPGGFPVPNVLWNNDGLGRLSPRELAHHDGGASLAWSRSALVADLDGDGRTDLLSLNAWGAGNTFYRQTENGALVDATSGSGLSGAIQDVASGAVGDVNGDGALDVLMLTRPYFGPSRLFLNDGRGHFHDVTSELGLNQLFTVARWAELADLDLDGDLDLVVITRSPGKPLLRLLLNEGRGTFTDVTTQAGVAQWAEEVVVEDFDGDGDLDLYLVRPGEANRLFLNEPPVTAGWLKVVPRSPPPNRAALGAQIRVYGPGGALLGMRETSWRHPVAHVGLGKADRVDVEVRFPSGRVVRREGVTAGQVLQVAEVSWLELWLRDAAFFVRHRWAWADKQREGYALLLALGWVIGLRRLGPRLGARRWAARRSVTLAMLGVYAVLSVASMPLAPVSLLAKVLPLGAIGGLGLFLLGIDRMWTRRAEARFVGHYELLGVLGEGGMGIVYRARDTTGHGRPVVALKVLRPDRVGNASSLRRFMQEAELGGRLRHPGIASVLESGECRVLEGRVWRTTAYLAMECVEGCSLASLLAEGELPLARAVEIVRDAAVALSAAHAAGVLHRDIKPDNLLLSPAGIVKLVDFGIAMAVRSPPRSEAGLLVGTLAYLPPERLAGRPEDARADLYALGAVLYEVVCRQRPFDGTKDAASLLAAVASELPAPPHALRPEVPRPLEALILSLLAKDPAERPQSAEQVIEALTAVLRGLAGRMEEAPVVEPAQAKLEPARQAALAPSPRAAAHERETLDMPAAEGIEVGLEARAEGGSDGPDGRHHVTTPVVGH
jgi:hypothetical protein